MQKHFSTQKMFMTIPKYHGGTMSHCTILDLCHTVRQFQIYFLSFAKVKTRCFLLFGTEKYSTMPIQLESLVYVLFSKSKMFDKKMSEKERVAKYREENKRATELATRKSIVIKKKNLPSDPFYKESKRRLSAPAYNDDMESDVE